MAGMYTPESLGIKVPDSMKGNGNWIQGRQIWNGTLSDPGVIHPQSDQQGHGAAVSTEVNAQSAAAQGKTPAELESYLQAQRSKSTNVAPVQSQPTGGMSGQMGVDPNNPSGGAGGVGTMVSPQPTIDLPSMYKSLYQSSGISDLEKELMSKEDAYNKRISSSNDNPWLSEASRQGRLAKLSIDHNNGVAALKNDIAMRKADVETQLQLQTKQFDINSQQAQQELQKFNSLLQMGALDGASGDDIANLTRATGLSSKIIQSAINATKASKASKRNTQVITSTNDAGMVTATVIDQETGEIIKQNNLGKIGNAEKGAAPKEAKPEEAVGQIIRSYLSDKTRQAQISPEDLYRELILQFPSAQPYISDNWTAQQMRDVIGN